MPQIFDRLVNQLKGKVTNPHAVAMSRLQKSGILDSHGKLTEKGKQRQAMGADGRAKDRAAKASGGKHKAGDYSYNRATNMATLRKNRKRKR
jgi:hypothetical protein